MTIRVGTVLWTVADMVVMLVVGVAVEVGTVLEVRMEGCHVGTIISVMSGTAVGVNGSNLERSLRCIGDIVDAHSLNRFLKGFTYMY